MAGAASIREDSPLVKELVASISADAAECAPLYIGDAEVLLSNLKGYAKRNKTVNEHAVALVEFLHNHPAVSQVWHPSISQKENYDLLKRKNGGYGGLLSFTLKQPKKAPKVYDALRLSKGPSFGTPFTLVCPYVLLAHYTELDWAEACGIPAHLLRVSVGLEPLETIIQAFETALS